MGWHALQGLLGNLMRTLQARQPRTTAATFQQQMAQAWRDFPGSILLLLSGKDLTAQEFTEAAKTAPEWQGAMLKPGLSVHTIPDADHTLSRAEHRRMAEDLTVNWLGNQA